MPVENLPALTPSRALIAGMVGRYSILDCGCTILEVQKLCWFLQRSAHNLGFEDPLDLEYSVDKYGPFSTGLKSHLAGFDDCYLRCEKPLTEAGPNDAIWFDPNNRAEVDSYLQHPQHRRLLPILDRAEERIDGYQSPFGLELLATVDWLAHRENAEATPAGIRNALTHWPPDQAAAERKLRLFNNRVIGLALQQLTN